MSALRLTTPGEEGGGGPRADQVSAWLDLLVSLLRIPEGERRSVRDELEDHLRQRVRDLILGGEAELSAARMAISELGDAAQLAQSLTHARNGPKRRKLMAFAAAGVAVLAAFTGLTLLSHTPPAVEAQPGGVPVSVFQPVAPAEAAKVAEAKVTARGGTRLADIFEFAGTAMGLPVTVRWGALQQADATMSPDSEVAEFTGLTLPEALTAINDARGLAEGIDFRILNGRLVFSSVRNFDVAETVLVTYDLHEIVMFHSGDSEGVTQDAIKVMTSVVYPEHWRENGGESASMARFGSKLFITAPRRMHEKIRWVLSEMKPGGAASAEVGGEAANAVAMEGTRKARLERINQERKRADEAAARAMADKAGAEEAGAKSADVKNVPLMHASAAEVSKALAAMLGANAEPSNGVSISSDARTNSVIVRAPRERLAMIEKVIALLDVKPRGDAEAGGTGK